MWKSPQQGRVTGDVFAGIAILLGVSGAKHQQKIRLLERSDNTEQLSKRQVTTPDSTTSPTTAALDPLVRLGRGPRTPSDICVDKRARLGCCCAWTGKERSFLQHNNVCWETWTSIVFLRVFVCLNS